MDANKQNLADFYNRVGAEIGWDFSRLKCTSEGETWDFYEEVKKLCRPNYKLLDIGTGGGEKILALADSLREIVGIDISAGMIKTAQNNLRTAAVSNVNFFVRDAAKTGLPAENFNVVSCRHSDFSPAEVFRLLVPGGIFMTQQVGEVDKINIKEFFGRGQSYQVADGTAAAAYRRGLQTAGFNDIDIKNYDAAEYYHRPEDLLFLLKHTPIIPDFGKAPDDFSRLAEFIRQNTTPRGIRTNSRRYLLVARKP